MTVDESTAEPAVIANEQIADPNQPAAWRVAAAGADGRSRRRLGALVIGVALASAAAGARSGSRIKSPAAEAAERQAPAPSRITVPVERQVLSSSLVLSGEVQYNEPTPIRLAGIVGVEEGEAQVITAVPSIGQLVQEGDVLLEVTGRPVFALQGNLPMYRRLSSGSEGPDVLQLETALERLGFAPGQVDNVFDAATAAAVSTMYTEAGYEVEGQSRAQREELRLAREAVTDAETALRDARDALERNVVVLPESQMLQLRQAVTAAEAAVPAAQQSADRAKQTGDREVLTATVVRDSARTIRDAAVAIRDSLSAPGAIDPNTGEPPTPERITELNGEVATAEEGLAQAELALTNAITTRDDAVQQSATAIQSARDNLDLARLQLREALAPADTADEQAAVEQSQAALDTANGELAKLEASAGVRVAPGELLFVPIAPTTVTELYVAPGSAATDQLGTLSTAETLVVSRVSRGDSGLVTVGAPVTIELRDIAISTSGTVLSVGPSRADPDGGGDAGNGGNGESSSSRLEVLVAPDDPAMLRDYVFFGARVTIDVASTEGEVLTVPVAALTVGPDGSSRVEVEVDPVTAESAGSTRLVEVEVGLTALGLVEIRSDELEPGDQVVVGIDSGVRRDIDSGGDSGDSGDAGA